MPKPFNIDYYISLGGYDRKWLFSICQMNSWTFLFFYLFNSDFIATWTGYVRNVVKLARLGGYGKIFG